MAVTKRPPGVAFYGKVRIPTIGHKAAIDQAKALAQQTGGRLTIGLSGAAQPLSSAVKREYAQRIFGHPVKTGDDDTKTLSSFLSHMSKNHDELHLIAGSDRVAEYQDFLKKYNNKKDSKGRIPFKFKKWTVHPAGSERMESNKDPRHMTPEELTRTVSASKVEALAMAGNYDHFKAYHPGMTEAQVKKLYGQIRKHHQLKEEFDLVEEITQQELAPMLDSFVSFASKKLGIKSMPKVRFKTDDDDYNSFAAYNPTEKELSVSTKSRHPMDVYRSVAHELVHHKQNEEGRIGKDIAKEGDTGSDIENEANAEAGKIMRWFAKENPDHFKKEHITEGINDPGKLKAIFLAGGPGSGKDFVMKSVLDGEGLKEINSDVAFEFLMHKNSLDLQMPEYEREKRDIVRGRAKNVTKEQQRLALAGRLGLIINGTADDIDKIKKIKSDLEYLGYETMMVFVNTSDEISRQRNVERGKMGKRKVPDGTDIEGYPDSSPNIRKEKWDAAQQNLGRLQAIFGQEKFAVIDNTHDTRKVDQHTKERVQASFNEVRRMAQQFVRKENKNPAAEKWHEREAGLRGITKVAPVKAAKISNQHALPIPVQKVSNEIMSQARRLGLSYYGFGRFGRKMNGKNTVLYKEKNGRLQRVITEGKNLVMSKKGKSLRNLMKAGKQHKVNEDFEKLIEGKDTHKMEWGTDYLRKDYEKNTPGSVKKMKPGPSAPEPMQTLPTTVVSESIINWVNSEKIQKKFQDKYGDGYKAKLNEAALKLERAGCGTKPVAKKTMKSFKEKR